MFVVSSLPHGLTIRHKGREILINGANVGFDPENLPKNGLAPDSALRHHGCGLTEVTGEDEAALKDWMDLTGKGDGPVKSGAIIVVGNKGDARKEAEGNEKHSAKRAGIDPEKELPKGVETKKD